MMRFIYTFCAALVLSVFFAGTFSGVEAAKKRVKGQYGVSKSPYWKVGDIDVKLSRACMRGEFKQRSDFRGSIGYTGADGRGITGIATKRWNLIDKRGLALPGFTYHFFGEGYSSCRVYVSPIPK